MALDTANIIEQLKGASILELNDLVHAIEHQQWLDAPENKREAPGTTNRSFDPVPLGHEPFPKIERVDE